MRRGEWGQQSSRHFIAARIGIRVRIAVEINFPHPTILRLPQGSLRECDDSGEHQPTICLNDFESTTMHVDSLHYLLFNYQTELFNT